MSKKKKSEHPPNVPEIKEGIIPLWHSGYYDGPLSGFCMYKGEPHFFDMKREYLGKRLWKSVYRTFWIYKLTPEQWEFEKYWHNEFRLHVGTHTDYEWNETEKKYQRFAGRLSSFSSNYWREMYYDRAEKARRESTVHQIDRRSQVVGWAIYDVVFGGAWFEWQRHKKKKAQNVATQKEGS